MGVYWKTGHISSEVLWATAPANLCQLAQAGKPASLLRFTLKIRFELVVTFFVNRFLISNIWFLNTVMKEMRRTPHRRFPTDARIVQ